eukprot:jgi/Botrbrau1/2933/Bobra.0026s0008.1
MMQHGLSFIWNCEKRVVKSGAGSVRAQTGPKEKVVTEEEVEEWARDLLPQYQVPRAFKVVDQIPRNSMGKVNKKELAAAFFPSG